MKNIQKQTIAQVHRLAFGEEEGKEVSKLAENFLALQETISIFSIRDDKIVGNILFTPFYFQDHPDKKCYLLAPCGVIPDYQRCGIGKELIKKSVEYLTSIDTDVIFVIGIPTFYPKYGFVQTDKETPYPDLLTIPESWMALELKEGSLEKLSGKITAVEPIMQSNFWDTSYYE